MTEVTIKNDIIDKLKKCINKNFISFECDFEEKWNRTYAYLRLNIDSMVIDISNEQEGVKLFGELEDVSYLKCKISNNISLKESYNLIATYKSKIINIDEKINNIYIISDIIEAEKEIMEIDMAIVIETEKHKYCFSRENWFDEFIYINIDKEFEEIYPLKNDIEDWEKEDIKINRYVKKI